MIEAAFVMFMMIVPALSAGILLTGFIGLGIAVARKSGYGCQVLSGAAGLAVGAVAVASVV